MRDLSQFLWWPFREVDHVITQTVMKRNHKGTYYDDDLPEGRARRYRREIKGNWAVGTPITFEIHTPDDESPFFLFRHWDWTWRLNWMMVKEHWELFKPEPYIRHEWVEEFITGVRRANRYYPHKKEKRGFPRTWRAHRPEEDVKFLGREDRRWVGAGLKILTAGEFIERQMQRKLQEDLCQR